MLMSVNNGSQNYTGGATIEKTLPQNGVYASLFNKINLTPVAEIGDLNGFEDNTVMAETSADARVTAAVQVFMQCLQKSGQKVEKLDKTLLDHHIAELDFQISRQLDEVMHSDEFQKTESVWRGLKSLVDKTDFRQNVKIEILDLSKDELRQDFEDSPEIIQSGLYRQTYTMEYDTPGGEPIAAVISAYEFDASAQDVALMRNISKVSAAAHMPFIGSAGPAFFLKENMEQVAAIKDIGNYFDRAEYIKWKSFRETDDSRYLGLVMPRVLGRLPYSPDTVPVRSFNYVEEVKGPDHDKYLWTNASFAFAANMVKSFINNGWCVQIRGPQAGGAVQDLPIHLYDLGTGKQVKIPSEVMIPETREFEFASLGFIPLADFAVADVSLFWLLNALNSAEPVLTELLQTPDRHPELLYRELSRLAGSLLTFSLEHDAGDLPAYQHDAPERVFPPLLALLDKLLEASLPSRVVSIHLEHQDQIWKGALHDARLREGADFYLSVRSSMPNYELQTKFPQLCKAGSFDDVSDVVNVALSGMVIKPLTHVPAAIPLRLENQYFSLDLSSEAARAMLEAGSCTFYTPRSLGDVKLELFAVLRT
ncbi:type VI secretion system contractile sheath large subunit [Klebsiella michiganensis]|uniref:type VI secretion system contractile sheath large subunit n=1 Tax=Klebsiella michiganensis TaxID=1134687 RepID=UPI001C28078E|nr:type VI secretion system contractile sheath large subunit [Klebsiella michiganensis]